MSPVVLKRRISGFALPITLILLVIITVTVMSSLDSGRAKERTAQRLQEREDAFQAAEAALRAGERWLEEQRSAPRGHGELPAGAAAHWDGRTPAAAGEIAPLTDSARGVFHIAPSQTPGIFVITARGTSLSSSATTVLRSHYHLERTPGGINAGRLSWQQLR